MCLHFRESVGEGSTTWETGGEGFGFFVSLCDLLLPVCVQHSMFNTVPTLPNSQVGSTRYSNMLHVVCAGK